MLAIARALIRRPRLICLFDEPFEGLAVNIVQNLFEVSRELVAKGQTIVLVEQNVRRLEPCQPDLCGQQRPHGVRGHRPGVTGFARGYEPLGV